MSFYLTFDIAATALKTALIDTDGCVAAAPMRAWPLP